MVMKVTSRLNASVDVPGDSVDNSWFDYHDTYGAHPGLTLLGVAAHCLLDLKLSAPLLLGVRN